MRTLDEVKASGKEMLVPTDIAPILNCAPYSINLQAQIDPVLLGFPVIVIGSRVKIPAKGFIRFCEGTGIGSK